MCDETAARLTERRNPRSLGLDTKPVGEILRLFYEEDRLVLDAVEATQAEVARTIGWVVEALRSGGRLFYVGSGTSGRLGVLDASECPPTFGVAPDRVVGIIAGGDEALRRSIEAAEDDPEAGARAMEEHAVSPRDVVIGIAASGRTPYVLGALREAHRRSARTVLLSCTPPEAALSRFVSGFITPLVGPEIITGSTRLKAGTATKLILNEISTIAMIRLGKVHDNWMIALQPTNAKLRGRARRVVSEIASVDPKTADEALDATDGHVKAAILMLKRGLSSTRARELFAESDISLREALEATACTR